MKIKRNEIAPLQTVSCGNFFHFYVHTFELRLRGFIPKMLCLAFIFYNVSERSSNAFDKKNSRKMHENA